MVDDAFTPLEPLDELELAPLPPVNVEAMLEQLYHPDPNLRMQAARIFCDLEEARATPRLVDLLDDSCPLVRVSAAYALGRNIDVSLVDRLIQALRCDWNGYVRKGLVWALGNTKAPQSIPILIESLQHDITAVRLWAASALGQVAQAIALYSNIQLAEIVTSLCCGLLTDPVPTVRSNCAWSLGKLSEYLDEATRIHLIHTLKRSLCDPDLGVVDDSKTALEKLGISSDDEFLL